MITVNIVIKTTLLNGSEFKEALDLSLVSAAFDQQVRLIFIDQGVNNLISGQNYHTLGNKNGLDLLNGLEFYDIDEIYVEQESLNQRGIQEQQLIEGCEILSLRAIKHLHQDCDHLLFL